MSQAIRGNYFIYQKQEIYLTKQEIRKFEPM